MGNISFSLPRKNSVERLLSKNCTDARVYNKYPKCFHCKITFLNMLSSISRRTSQYESWSLNQLWCRGKSHKNDSQCFPNLICIWTTWDSVRMQILSKQDHNKIWVCSSTKHPDGAEVQGPPCRSTGLSDCFFNEIPYASAPQPCPGELSFTESIYCCCCLVTKLRLTLWDPVDCSMPGSSVLHYLLEFAQIHVHWVGDAI